MNWPVTSSRFRSAFFIKKCDVLFIDFSIQIFLPWSVSYQTVASIMNAFLDFGWKATTSWSYKSWSYVWIYCVDVLFKAFEPFCTQEIYNLMSSSDLQVIFVIIANWILILISAVVLGVTFDVSFSFSDFCSNIWWHPKLPPPPTHFYSA